MENKEAELLLKIQKENLTGTNLAKTVERQMCKQNGEIIIRAITDLAMPTYDAIVDEVCNMQGVNSYSVYAAILAIHKLFYFIQLTNKKEVGKVVTRFLYKAFYLGFLNINHTNYSYSITPIITNSSCMKKSHKGSAAKSYPPKRINRTALNKK